MKGGGASGPASGDSDDKTRGDAEGKEGKKVETGQEPGGGEKKDETSVADEKN